MVAESGCFSTATPQPARTSAGATGRVTSNSEAYLLLSLIMVELSCDGLLFDLDGVLVDSTPAVARVWSKWATAHGLNPEQTVQLAHGRPSIATVRDILPQADYVAENANVAATFRDYVTGGDESSANEIKNGEGAILHDGARKIAAYRDENGTLYEFSAVCPHLKCIVRWGSCEKTWDCPCHGSRFDALGRIVNGPAISDLEPVEGAVASDAR